MQGGQFRLPGKKHLGRGFEPPEVVVMDVTETPIERPKRRQRQFYSGKKKQHMLKSQFVIDLKSGQILCTFFGHWTTTRFQAVSSIEGAREPPKRKTCKTGVIKAFRSCMRNSQLPHKKARGGPFTATQKAENRALARRRRVRIEQVNRCLKIFRILAERYRNRRRRCQLALQFDCCFIQL